MVTSEREKGMRPARGSPADAASAIFPSGRSAPVVDAAAPDTEDDREEPGVARAKPGSLAEAPMGDGLALGDAL